MDRSHAWHVGYRDYNAGADGETDNPFEEKSTEWWHWRDGWMQAQRTERIDHQSS